MLEGAPESERSDAFSLPVSEGDNSARQGFNQVQNFKMSGQHHHQISNDEDAADLLAASGHKSTASNALDGLEVGLEDANSQPGLAISVSEIVDKNAGSSGKKADGEDDLAEMEKLLKSGGAFGGKDLSNTFKKIRGEIAAADFNDEASIPNSSAKKNGMEGNLESDIDMPMHDNSKLMMESPGSNTFV